MKFSVLLKQDGRNRVFMDKVCVFDLSVTHRVIVFIGTECLNKVL